MFALKIRQNDTIVQSKQLHFYKSHNILKENGNETETDV